MFPAWSLEGVEGLVTLIIPSCRVMATSNDAAEVQQEIQVTNALSLLWNPGRRRRPARGRVLRLRKVQIERPTEEGQGKTKTKLSCLAYREVLSIKASITERHIESSKHKSGKTRLALKEKQNANISEAMKRYEEEARPKG